MEHNNGIAAGRIIILNGAPRSGKSSIVEAIQAGFDGVWVNLGVDVYVRHVTPERYRPGIGLRPGGERPDLEPLVPRFYAALYESIAAHSRAGFNVVAEFGHHDAHSRPLGILGDCAQQLAGLPVLFVGVRCSLDVVMQRRMAEGSERQGTYVAVQAGAPIPTPVIAWQEHVHKPGIYDLEVDTTARSPQECAKQIQQMLALGAPHPSAFERLATAG
ncbi:chloramphenicol phosphotransferase CPT family protein [Rhizobium lusitanum]|uniref:Chloramphenicol 3-O phosphotransferase n=1 Tax=Rhizobium lusitanum TaxID=293958 RepID=A0A7X0ILM1_9HYPH|nr:chloramphenicol phosphotransferase [Rhizobium lusitanum]MBB6482984.1 chloramphenicol 3-O phosphotransferase [Rhizobium lusitanum]